MYILFTQYFVIRLCLHITYLISFLLFFYTIFKKYRVYFSYKFIKKNSTNAKKIKGDKMATIRGIQMSKNSLLLKMF